MTSPQKYAIAPLYKLEYSKKVFGFEIFFHGLILISIFKLISGVWILLILLLYLLLTIRFFQNESVTAQFSNNTTIEFRINPDKLIWTDQTGSSGYLLPDIKIFITRWFILLQLGRGKTKINRLLLADSFDDISRYTCFRRQLIEKYLC